MGNICKGSWYGEDWQVYTNEDQRACQEAGGTVVSTGGGGCGSTNVASMAVGPNSLNRGVLAELSLEPFRRVRAMFGTHDVVRSVLQANELMAAEIKEFAEQDPTLQAELIDAFITLSGLAKAITTDAHPRGHLDEESFGRVACAVRHLTKLSKNPSTQSTIERALTLAQAFVGLEFSEIADKLKAVPTFSPYERATKEIQLPEGALFSPSTFHRIGLADLTREELFDLGELIALQDATTAIESKSIELGWVGAALGGIQVVAGGYHRRYENADIYVGSNGVAYEVHGDIRAKYNLLGGAAGPLGLPVTDETVIPDGVGRYNHFAKDGSIYWTPNTGPFMVRGRVRQDWASQGWENGPMGYPVHDQQAMPGLHPSDHPNLAWCLFQNGAILSIAGAAATAVYAEIRPDQMRAMIRSFFDGKLKAANSDLGLEAPVEITAISDWTFGFWAAEPRRLTFTLHGFHNNGLAPDTTFDLHVRLRFSTTWTPLFTYPSALTLIASLEWVQVHADGLGSKQLADGLVDGIFQAFWRGGPDPDNSAVPNGAVFLTSIPTGASQTGNGNLDVIDVLTTVQGGLQILLNPLPPSIGGLRKQIAQQRVDAFLGL